jgi:hypothetical protein
MGMMVTGRKVAETATTVRYEFGLDEEFDRVLTIDKETWDVRPEDGRVDAVVGAIASKIKGAWRERGEFPAGAVFAS